MAPAKKEVATTTENEIAVLSEMPEWMKGMQEDNSGNEDVGKDDLIIPRLAIVQAISPELDKNDPAYIPGAENGMMFNTLTRELMTEIMVISIKFEKPFLLWRDRKKGGGFGGQYPTTEEADAARSAFENPAEWEITDTPTNLCIAIPADGSKPYEIAIPLPKSKAKVSRSWNSLIRLAGGPRFGRIYKITPCDDKNSTGEKYKNFKVELAGFPSEALFKMAQELYKLVDAGELKYQPDYSDESTTTAEADKPAF